MDEKRLLEVLEEIGAENIRVASKNIQFSCVLADYREGHSLYSDHAGSMGVSIRDNEPSEVHCFSCGFGGSLPYLLTVLGRHQEKDYSVLIKRVEDIEDLDPTEIAYSVGEYDSETELEEDKVLGECVLEMLFRRGGHTSILERGISIETLKAWDSRYDGRYKRVVFPIRKHGKEGSGCAKNLVGAVGRTVNGHELKYYNYFDVGKSRYLFGEHMQMLGSKAVVVEGALDTIGVWQELSRRGLLDQISVMGLLGSGASKIQAKKLVRWFDEVILFFDNDPAGWTGQRVLAKLLQNQVLLKAVRYRGISRSDPLELLEQGEDIVEHIQNAKLLVV